MTRPLDHSSELASPSEPNSAAPLLQPASDERRAPTAILSSAKRAALIACLNGGSFTDGAGSGPRHPPAVAISPSPVPRLQISGATAC